jgi:hypothetical protein
MLRFNIRDVQNEKSAVLSRGREKPGHLETAAKRQFSDAAGHLAQGLCPDLEPQFPIQTSLDHLTVVQERYLCDLDSTGRIPQCPFFRQNARKVCVVGHVCDLPRSQPD